MKQLTKREDLEGHYVIKPSKITSPLILTSPHSGDKFSNEFLENLNGSIDICRSIEDKHIDDILIRMKNSQIPILAARYSRAVIDLNRKISDINPGMVKDSSNLLVEENNLTKSGIGLIPEYTPKGKIMFKDKISSKCINERLNNFYYPWHNSLKIFIKQILINMGFVFLLDCHSMPSYKERKIPDFVLGDRYGISCDDSITSFVKDFLINRGYTVGINNPYAGGFITDNYYDKERNVQTMQLEIKRDLYMSEDSYNKNSNFIRLVDDLKTLIVNLDIFLKKDLTKSIAAE